MYLDPIVDIMYSDDRGYIFRNSVNFSRKRTYQK